MNGIIVRPLCSLLAVSGVLSVYGQEPTDTVAGGVSDEILEEVVVTATRAPVQATAEKTTYDVAADPESKSLTLLDMLRKVPGVTVDAQDNVTVNGSSNFSVEVDGRQNPMFSQQPGRIFKSIPASMVQRVEVVNSPGARYDAEGVGGVLNIIMKSADETLDGFSLTLGADGSNFGGRGSLFAMMQKGRVGATFELSGGHNGMPDMTIGLERRQDDGYALVYDGIIDNKFDYGFASVDLAVRLSDCDKLAVSGAWHLGSWGNLYNADAAASMSSQLISVYRMRNDDSGRYNSVSAGADYTHMFTQDSRHKIRVAYQFDTQPARSVSEAAYYALSPDYTGVVPAPYYDVNHKNMPQHMALAEYSLPIGELHLIEAGGKMTWRKSTSSATDLDYVHRSEIAAAFASYALRAGDFTAKAGLRYEHTAQKARFNKGNGVDFSAGYDNLVPSATVGWSFSGANNLSAAYDMRISRPGIDYLNPYVDEENPLDIRRGNPYLKPERHNNLSLAYSGMYGPVMLSARLTYSFCNDGLTEIIDVVDGMKYTTFANALHRKSVNLTMYANWRIGSKTTLQCNIVPKFSTMHAGALANHGWDLNIFAGVQQKLPWKLNLGVNIFAMTPVTNLQGRGMSQFIHMLTIGRSFLKEDRLNVSVQALCPFYGKLNINQTEWGPGFSNRMTGHINIRMVQFSVSWRIGDLNTRVKGMDKLDSDAVGGSPSSGNNTPSPGVGM